METIHFKTVDPVSQDLLRDAARKGICLNWERYEKQQPQDGFLRLGLCCPYGCMQGPCRIDPFGRGTQHGICGLDRDGMAAAFLLRLSLQGALETMALHPAGAEIAWPAPLASKAAAVLGETGGQPPTFADILEGSRMLARPSATPATLIRQAIRLALLSAGLHGQAKPAPAVRAVRVGYGLLAGDAIRIGVTGRIPQADVEALLKETAGLKNPEVHLLSLGDWIPAGEGFLPIACTAGEAETVLTSGKLNLILAGDGCDPGILALCGKMKLPIVSFANNAGAAEILKRAGDAFNRRIPDAFTFDAALITEGKVNFEKNDVLSALKSGGSARIALIGGADTPLLSLGHLPTELAKALRAEDHAVASWGDAALWMMKQEIPVGVLDAEEGPMTAVRTLTDAGRLPSLKGICFTGLRNNREFTLALGLAAVGLKVLIATPLPLWGSEKVRTLLRDNLAVAGGILTHFDRPVRPDEVLDWFLRS